MEDFAYIFIFAIYVLLGLIPANIAKKKGRSFIGWWIYGTLIFVVATIHAALISPKYATEGSAPKSGKGQYVKTFIWILLVYILIPIFKSSLFKGSFEPGFVTVLYLVFGILLLVKRTKGTNIALVFPRAILLILALGDFFSGGATFFARLLSLVGPLYFFLVVLFGAIPSRRDTALGLLKVRALPGIVALFSWVLNVGTLISNDVGDVETVMSGVFFDFFGVMLIFSIGKSLVRVYGVDHPNAYVYYTAASSYTPPAAAPATTTYTPPTPSASTTSSTSAPMSGAPYVKSGTTSTYTASSAPATPTPAPTPTPTPVPAAKPTPAPIEKKEEKSVPAPVPTRSLNEPVYSFEGAKNRSLTVYENRAVLRISVSDSEGDERTYDRTFLYEDLLAIEFKKGSIQLGSVYFKEEDSDAPNDLFGENTFPFDVKTLPNTEVEGACRFMKKKIREARR